MRNRHLFKLAALTPFFLSIALTMACDDDPVTPEAGVTFVVEVSGEQFRVRVSDPARIADFEARLTSGTQGVVNGPLVSGHGGFNQPWTWHLDPDQVATADMAIEVCDGRPSMVQADTTYWLGTVKRFCPWGAKVVKRES